MGKLIYEDRNGYVFISNNGIKYDVLEGVSLDGSYTSDMAFIVLIDEEIWGNAELATIDRFVGFFMGATFITDVRYAEEYINYIENLVNEYEEKHPEIVECKKHKLKNIYI